MSRKLITRLAIGLAVIVVLAGIAFANVKSIILFAVGNLGKEKVGPTQEVVWSQGPATPAPGERPPNVVVILADDLGINDISTFGGGVAQGLVPTPNIDALAASGAIMPQAYSGTAACAPSRAMLMTGRYPTRHGFEFTPTPNGMQRILTLFYNDGTRPHEMIGDPKAEAAQPSFQEQGLPGSEVTVAEVLKPRGYHTVHIGKWHLGGGPEFSANAQGFDESLLMASSLYLPEKDPRVVNAKLPFDPIDKFLWARMQHAATFNNGPRFAPPGYLTDYYTDEALKVIDANRNRPFFLYLAHWGVHSPLQASKADYDALPQIKDHRLRVYAAMVRALDRSVGRVMQKLRDDGLAENTVVIFTSDNGGAGYLGLPDVNKPYRGWKLTFFEGGIRVPYFVSWPGHIAPGTRLEDPVSHIDLLPTVAAVAGAAPPADRPIDGANLLPYLTGGPKPATPPHEAIFWQDGHYLAVLKGGWKLQTSERPKKDWLFHVAVDPTEQQNLAAANPAKVAELKAAIAEHRRGGKSALFPYTGQMPVTVDKTLEQKATAADEYIYWPG
ncbi:MAG: sulfatase-like hydrolase/transferase [Caulobacteraceae bacterium]|nr:sulfatase-like hydrolase/transferase [Caulobacteraceae bacterium]